MNKALVQEWIYALESGDYEQGSEALRPGTAGETYCCLGVACDLLALRGEGKWRFKDRYSEWAFYIQNQDGTGYPPVGVERAYDMTGSEFKALAELNDTRGLSFTEIAQVLREKLAEASDAQD